MKSLKKRLARLESVLCDESHCERYSEEWFGYWGQQLERVMNGERIVAKIPLEFFDAIIAEADVEDALRDRGSRERERYKDATEASAVTSRNSRAEASNRGER